MQLSPKTLNILTQVARGLLILAFGAAASAKLAGVPMMVAIYEQIGFGQNFRLLVGSLELLGVLMLLFPRSLFFGALWFGGIMIGAILTHVLLIGGTAVPAMVLGLLAAFIAWQKRPAFFRTAG